MRKNSLLQALWRNVLSTKHFTPSRSLCNLDKADHVSAARGASGNIDHLYA
jgi:hypothetical protein